MVATVAVVCLLALSYINAVHSFSSPFLRFHGPVRTPLPQHEQYDIGRSTPILLSSSANTEDELVFAVDPDGSEDPEVTDDDRTWISGLYGQSNKGENRELLETLLLQALPTLPPSLIVALRKAATTAPSSNDGATEEEEDIMMFQTVGKTLEHILDTQLLSGRELLEEFLESGELRKLDACIGSAQRENKLDMAFFTVLSMNLRDAAQEKSAKEDDDDNSAPSRLSILQHVYTRCQEEVEKTVDPGVALLNKLLRTEIPSIRSNQLQHYLCPQRTSTIVTPDGKELQIEGDGKPLVTLEQFIDAMDNAVKQIRQVQMAGGTDRRTAANLVESIRQMAIDARLVLATEYGADSDELQTYEKSLQPVFRPGSTV